MSAQHRHRRDCRVGKTSTEAFLVSEERAHGKSGADPAL